MLELMPHQKEALDLLGNGRILYGGVGSGKSLVALAYYLKEESDKDVIVITTAKKRDSLEWEGEAAKLRIGTRPEATLAGVLTVDSWNNIARYREHKNCFFIFDEQRAVGGGVWAKSFIKIAKRNRWILLTATPGDSWMDYAPAFLANGWYTNITEFKRRHVVYAPYLRYPKIDGYIDTRHLERLRSRILVEMPYEKPTRPHMNYMDVGYDLEKVKLVIKNRWHYEEDRPLEDYADLWRYMRRIVNSDASRLDTIRQLLTIHPKLIIFYNFNYELEILRTLGCHIEVAEWNGHRHEEIPEGDRWVYLVQYASGSEGWNCVRTNAMCFYSQTYSYKMFAQSLGRINRLNAEILDLYYYILVSGSVVDKRIKQAMEAKRDFNEAKEAHLGPSVGK